MIPVPSWISPSPSPHPTPPVWSQFKPPPSHPNHPRIANEEVRLMLLKFPPFPTLSPYRAPRLASNKCCLSVAFMRPRAGGARLGSGARTPSEVSPGSGARDTRGRGLTCGVSSARRSRRPTRSPSPPLRLAPARAPAALGSPWDRPAVAPLQSPLCAQSAPASPRPASARFISPSPPRVKRPAARRVQKPAGKGEEVAGCNGCPGAAPEHRSPAPWGPGIPSGL